MACRRQTRQADTHEHPTVPAIKSFKAFFFEEKRWIDVLLAYGIATVVFYVIWFAG